MIFVPSTVFQDTGVQECILGHVCSVIPMRFHYDELTNLGRAIVVCDVRGSNNRPIVNGCVFIMTGNVIYSRGHTDYI